MAQVYKLQFDGSISKNPGGVAAYGFLLSKDGREIYAGHSIIGEGPLMSNNVAEYQGLINGLITFKNLCITDSQYDLYVEGDSQLVIRQMKGEWKAKEDKLYYPHYLHAKHVLESIESYAYVSFTWVPREQNTACDDLSKVHRKKEI